jgi:phage terminase small subunit
MPTRSRGRNPRSSKGKGKKRAVAERKPRSPGGASTSPATSARPPKTVSAPHGIFVDEGLTGAQLRFVEELCADITKPAVHAARLAYPRQTEDALRVTASENLTKPNIKAAIARRLSPSLRRGRADKERVLHLLGDSLNADKRGIIGADGSVLPFQDWPIEIARLCTGFDHEEIKIGDAVVGRVLKPRFTNYLELLSIGAKANKMLTEKVEHSGALLEDLVAASRKAG